MPSNNDENEATIGNQAKRSKSNNYVLFQSKADQKKKVTE